MRIRVIINYIDLISPYKIYMEPPRTIAITKLLELTNVVISDIMSVDCVSYSTICSSTIIGGKD